MPASTPTHETPKPDTAPSGTSWPTLAELHERAVVISLPMRVTFRGVNHREMMLFPGPAGWGEFGAFPEYDDEEAAHWLANGLEMAWDGPPTTVRTHIPVNGTIPALNAVTQQHTIRRLVQQDFAGVRTFKIKVAERGQSWADDVARVALVHHYAPTARLRVDANMGWTVAEARDILPRIVEAAGGSDIFDYAEQPCRTVPELVELHEALAGSIPLAADESIRRAADPLRVIEAGAVDRVVVKAAPLGGPRALLRLATHIPYPLTVSSALDSAVGMNAGLAAAAALPTVADCGLGTGSFFTVDVCEPHQLADGLLPYRLATPDPARLEELRAPVEREQWWRERLERCYPLAKRLANTVTSPC